MATSLLKVSVSDVLSKFESNKDYVRLIDSDLGTIQFSSQSLEANNEPTFGIFGIPNTDFGIGIGISKYRISIRYFGIPTQDYCQCLV